MTIGKRFSAINPYLPIGAHTYPGTLSSVEGRSATAWGVAHGTSNTTAPVAGGRRIYRRLIRRSATAGARRWR